MELLTDFKTKLEQLHADMCKTAEDGLKAALSNFFKTFPEIESVRWVQYVPGFNDGEACEFTVGDLSATLSPIGRAKFLSEEQTEEADDKDDEYYGENGIVGLDYRYDYKTKTFKYANPSAQETGNAVHQFSEIISSDALEPILKKMFGYNVIVVAKADKVTIAEYDCGF